MVRFRGYWNIRRTFHHLTPLISNDYMEFKDASWWALLTDAYNTVRQMVTRTLGSSMDTNASVEMKNLQMLSWRQSRSAIGPARETVPRNVGAIVEWVYTAGLLVVVNKRKKITQAQFLVYLEGLGHDESGLMWIIHLIELSKKETTSIGLLLTFRLQL